ncbi:MAG: hypothetical protein K5924_07645 [Chloroflexi bacterium]|nr:hypothetical protein [Chloroflexota bacterium]
MHHSRRPYGLAAIALLALAACAPAGTGAGDPLDPSAPPVSPIGSGAADHEDEVAPRVSIDDVLAEPEAHVDADITIMENIDEEYVEDRAFLFSGTEVQGQLLVVLADGATIEKTIQPDRVVAVTGRIIPFTTERMEAAGLDLTVDDEAVSRYGGNAVLVATHVADPLAT